MDGWVTKFRLGYSQKPPAPTPRAYPLMGCLGNSLLVRFVAGHEEPLVSRDSHLRINLLLGRTCFTFTHGVVVWRGCVDRGLAPARHEPFDRRYCSEEGSYLRLIDFCITEP